MFKKGEVANPNGRPKGSTNKFSVAMLQKAFDQAATKHNKQTILQNLAEKAYEDPQLGLALLRFMMATKKESTIIEPNSEWNTLTPSEAAKLMDDATCSLDESNKE